jgi:hypothetical protein
VNIEVTTNQHPMPRLDPTYAHAVIHCVQQVRKGLAGGPIHIENVQGSPICLQGEAQHQARGVRHSTSTRAILALHISGQT